MSERRPLTKQRLYFLHVMKTGGYALTTQLWDHFAPEQVYGGYGATQSEFLTSTFFYLNPRPLALLDDETLSRFHMFAGHFPFAARDLMGDDVCTFTVLRDPVDRVISLLKHAQRNHVENRDMSLEEIFEDPWLFPRFLDNHEVKMLAMTREQMLAHSSLDGFEEQGWDEEERALLRRWREDPAGLTPEERLRFHYLAVPIVPEARGVYRLVGAPNTADVVVDQHTVARAISNLERVEIVGVYEDYGRFIDDLSRHLGVDLRSDVRRNVSEPGAVSSALRNRIAAGLGPSYELYEAACEMARSRRRAGSAQR